jgi:DNA helicase HerA-like ATPase
MFVGNGRLGALQAAEQAGVFSSVVLGARFWTEDPLDVPTLHAEARREFRDLLEALRADPLSSRLMVILGEVGSGKTHLLRALRASAAHDYDAVCAYAQFNSPGDRFERHFLGRLVFSCSQKTSGNGSEEDAFARALVRARALAPDIAAELERAWEAEDGDPVCTAQLVARLADVLLARIGPDVDPYTVRALIYASAPQAGVRALARQYLSGGPLTRLDTANLPALPETGATDRAQEQFYSLARALAALAGGPLVYFLDQAEDLFSMGAEKPREALECVYRLIDTVPNVAVVISWELTRYNTNFVNLPQFLQGRLHNSSIVSLRGQRTVPEIRELLARRVSTAFKTAAVEADANNLLDPLPRDLPEQLIGGATRTVLSKTRDMIRQLAQDGTPPEPIDNDDNLEHLESAWEAHLSNYPIPNELADSELLKLTAWACTEAVASDGSPAGVALAGGANGSVQWCDLNVPTAGAELRLFALTRNAQGGGLRNQINAALAARGERTPVGLRLANFPGNPQTQTVQKMMQLFASGGYRVVGSESDVHIILAFREFIASDVRNAAGFDRWKSQAKVLEQLPLIRGVLRLPSSPNAPRNHTPDPDVGAGGAPRTPRLEESPSQTGTTGQISAPLEGPLDRQSIPVGVDPHGSVPVAIPMGTLTRHTAVLGGSGSGKTTLILRIVEQCLLRGVPAVLLDRKGDFSAYADPGIWSAMQGQDGAQLQRQAMVSLFTPGKTAGRPLALRLLPQDYASLDEDERSEASRSAAEALAQMLGMKDNATDRERREVLRQAIDEIGRQADRPLDLPSLIDGLATDHQGLLDRLLRLDPRSRHRQRLIPMLEQLRLSRGYLFSSDGDQLDFANLIRPSTSDRARLAVISLAFIPDLGDQQFFVSRLLAEARRFCRTRPSKSLQVLLVLDEADVFMPATSKPATKEPLLDLLRRARSGGMGIVIGTQSPGDLDYKGRDNITTWALGRIQDNTALEKIKFAGEGTAFDIRTLLPRFSAGRFLVRTDGTASEVQAYRSLVETTQVAEERILELAIATRQADAK